MEGLEEKRIDTAIDALALVYESKFVFDYIRSEIGYSTESKDMPGWPGDTEAQRNEKGPFYAVLKRIEANKDFFERAWKLQVRCTAILGPDVEKTFLFLHKARRAIEVSAGMLMRDPHPHVQTDDNLKSWDRFRADVWPSYGEREHQQEAASEPQSKRLYVATPHGEAVRRVPTCVPNNPPPKYCP